jgi:hypothetical protein
MVNNFATFTESRHFFLSDNFNCISESFRSCSVATEMLSKPGIEVDCRSDVVSAGRSVQDIDPRDNRTARGEIRTPDQGLMSPLLYH